MTFSRASARGVQGFEPPPGRRSLACRPVGRQSQLQALSIDQGYRIWYKLWMHPDAASPLLPFITLAAGVFLLIAPRIVSVAVAVYLIGAGLLGLNGIYHFFK
jgi:DUF3096 family protein